VTFGGSMTLLETILQITAIVFGAGGILSFFLNLRRTKAQNTLDLSTAWEKFSKPLLDRIEHLETLVTQVEKENRYLRRYVERLIRQIIQLGGVPEPYPYHFDDHDETEEDHEPKVP
jgi:hypothetical protein